MEKQQAPTIHVGQWIVGTEDGFWTSSFSGEFGYKTKKEAIDDVSIATMDTRNKPKVIRLKRGEYMYTPRDVDSNEWGENYYIELITEENIKDIQEQLTEQWEEDR